MIGHNHSNERIFYEWHKEDEDELVFLHKRIRMKQFWPESLRYVKIKLTWKCNAQCKGCLYSKKKNMDNPDRVDLLNEELLSKRLLELKEMGCLSVGFSGGEPLLSPLCPFVIKTAKNYGLRVKLSTNGSLLDAKNTAWLMAANVDHVVVSLDSSISSVHNSRRGYIGLWEKACRGLSLLAQNRSPHNNNLLMQVNSIIDAFNYKEIPDLIYELKKIGVDKLSLMPVDGDSYARLNTAQIKEFYYLLNKILNTPPKGPQLLKAYPFGRSEIAFKEAVAGRYSFFLYNKIKCQIPLFHLFVRPDGKVYPCCRAPIGHTDFILGDITKMSFKSIWNGNKHKSCVNQLTERPFSWCCGCDEWSAFNILHHLRVQY